MSNDAGLIGDGQSTAAQVIDQYWNRGIVIGVAVKTLIGLVAVGGAGTAVVAAVSPSAASARSAVVTHLVDGDTFDASIDGRTERIRMLNIDTPETKDPDEAVQCLGPEASAFLASLIPVGTAIRLEYDEERIDRYGRTLAGVFTTDGALVNAEVARAGLAAVVDFDDNDRFLPPVQEAQQEAAEQRRGLYAPDVSCTLPAKVEVVTAAVAAAPTAGSQPATASAATLETAAGNVGAVVAIAGTLNSAFTGPRKGGIWAAFTSDEQEAFGSRVATALGTARREEAALRSAASAARDRESTTSVDTGQHTAPAARPSAAPLKPKPAPAPPKPPAAQPKPAPPPAANPYPGYTGPRCYAPGGKTWKPC